MNTLSARELLKRELAKRCQKNPRYSLRAMAKAIGMSHTVLSLVLSGKRPLSKKAVYKVGAFLALNPEQTLKLLSDRNQTILPAQSIGLSLDQFAIISDWYHYAILSLIETPLSQSHPAWFAKRLNISQTQAMMALDRLERLGLIELDQNKNWVQTHKILKVENTVSTPATREFHKQALEKAIDSIENDPFELRNASSVTLAMTPELMPFAKEKIKLFRRELATELEKRSSNKKNQEVYFLTVQLFPVSRP